MEITHMKNHLKVLRQNYNLIRTLVNKNGWRWDAINNMPVPPDPSMWTEVITANSDYAKVKDKHLSYYETFYMLFCNTIATRKRACYFRKPLKERSDSSDDGIIDMTKDVHAPPVVPSGPLDEGVQNLGLDESSQSPPNCTPTAQTQPTVSIGKRTHSRSTPLNAQIKKGRGEEVLEDLVATARERLNVIKRIADREALQPSKINLTT